jgi:hypothetical protein
MVLLDDWTPAGKLLSIGTIVVLSLLAFWKGLLPWLRSEWADNKKETADSRADFIRAVEENKKLLLDEIHEARQERDEQRALRGNELAAFLNELKAQRELHEQGFAKLATAIRQRRQK